MAAVFPACRRPGGGKRLRGWDNFYAMRQRHHVVAAPMSVHSVLFDETTWSVRIDEIYFQDWIWSIKM